MNYCDFASHGKYMGGNYNNVRLEKGMYGEVGRSFSHVLEGVDPSENYHGTALEGLDAYQRQLKRFDIKVKGTGSDAVEKFFRTSESAVLFPEYVSRMVRQGMEEGDILPSITATVTKIDRMDYRSIASVPDKGKKEMKDVAEGAGIPQTMVQIQENLVKLHKRGRMLVATYEAVRYQRLDLFSVVLRQIGGYINRMHLEDAVNVLENGDGNENAAQIYHVDSRPIGHAEGQFTYDSLVNFWAQFDPYEMNTLLVPSDMMLKILKMQELQNPLAGLNFGDTGAKLLRTAAISGSKIIGLDRRYALEMVQCGGVTVDYDRLIDRQFERSAITATAGFAKVFKDASKVLKI